MGGFNLAWLISVGIGVGLLALDYLLPADKKRRVGVWLLVASAIFICGGVAGWGHEAYVKWLKPHPSVVTTNVPPLSAPPAAQAPTKTLKTQKMPSEAKPQIQINNAPNGIAIGGGTVNNPTVNNLTSRPDPKITWSQVPSKVGDNLAVVVAIELDGPTDIPAFLAVCDRACEDDDDAVTVVGVSQTNHFSIKGHPEMTAFQFLMPTTLLPGLDLKWKIHSVDDKPIKVVSVQRLSPTLLPKSK